MQGAGRCAQHAQYHLVAERCARAVVTIGSTGIVFVIAHRFTPINRRTRLVNVVHTLWL